MLQGRLPLSPMGANEVNDLVSVVKDENSWIYFINFHPVFKHKPEERILFYLIACQLIESGFSRQVEILMAFGCPKRTLINWQGKYREKGIMAFFHHPTRRKGGTKLTNEVLLKIQCLLDEGWSYGKIADETGIKSETIRKAVSDKRLRKSNNKSKSNSDSSFGMTKSARTVRDAEAAAGMGTACNRTDERLLAAIGKLSGASVQFPPSLSVPRGGALCALPALLENGLLLGINEHLGQLHGYYTQYHILLLLAIMALCRIKTVEQLAGKPSGEIGILLGLDRCPEVHCLRQKMDEMSGRDNAAIWASHLSQHWMQSDPDRCGYLYIDGHVSVYNGNSTKLPRRYVSRQRLCLRGITNYWVNDSLGCPFFSVEKQIDNGLLKTLQETIVPRLIQDIPNQPSDEQLSADPLLPRFTIVFDREGYSPKFFQDMWENHRIACLTYHKHSGDAWDEQLFITKQVKLIHGEIVDMRLAEKMVPVGKNKFMMREIRKLSDTGHQTSIIGTVYKPAMEIVAPAMFARWCQENFFGYMMQHFGIDLLAEYSTEPFHGTEMIVNPQWKELENRRNSLTSKVRYQKAKFAELEINPIEKDEEKRHQKWEGDKAKLLEDVEKMSDEIDSIKKQKKETPKHITVAELPKEQTIQRLVTSRKRLFDTVKMIVYRAETAMANLMITLGMACAEARAILRELFLNEADILLGDDGKTLRVIIHGMANPATNRAVFHLLEILNKTETEYPGTNLRMVFESAVQTTTQKPPSEINDELLKESEDAPNSG